MAWVYLDESFPDHPKVVEAGDQAAWLFVAGLCWCKRHGTDGRIPAGMVPRLTSLSRSNVASKRLVDAGLWHRDGDTFVVNDWSDWNRSQESRSEAGRKAARARWDAKRNADASDSHSDRIDSASDSHMPQDALSPPLPTGSTSTPSSPAYPAAGEEGVENSVAKAVAHARLAAAHPAVRNPEAWKRTVIASLLADDEWRGRLAELRAGYPDATLRQLADAIEGKTEVLRYLRRAETT